jgi:hypothetical protein
MTAQAIKPPNHEKKLTNLFSKQFSLYFPPGRTVGVESLIKDRRSLFHFAEVRKKKKRIGFGLSG